MNSKRKKQRKERDALGSRFGTVASRVNLAMNLGWKTDEEIAKDAGIKLRRARARLYHGAQTGIYERARIIQYRLTPLARVKRAEKGIVNHSS